MAGNKEASKTQVKAILTPSVLPATADENTQARMAQMIADMNLSVPVKAIPAEPAVASKKEKLTRIPKLTQPEILIITALASPNEWFLAHRSNRRRTDIGLRGMGEAFEMVTRKEGGIVNHYIRYTGKSFSAIGEQRMERLRAKMELLQQIAEGKVKTAGSTPHKKSLSERPTNLEVARRWPLNDTEQKFLRLIAKPNTSVLLEQGITQNQLWHTFRWKWQNRYGFDLSQLAFSQEKREDGTFDIYGFYKPNADGSMNPGLMEFVEFLNSKPTSASKSARSTSSTPESTGPRFRFGRQAQSESHA